MKETDYFHQMLHDLYKYEKIKSGWGDEAYRIFKKVKKYVEKGKEVHINKKLKLCAFVNLHTEYIQEIKMKSDEMRKVLDSTTLFMSVLHDIVESYIT